MKTPLEQLSGPRANTASTHCANSAAPAWQPARELPQRHLTACARARMHVHKYSHNPISLEPQPQTAHPYTRYKAVQPRVHPSHVQHNPAHQRLKAQLHPKSYSPSGRRGVVALRATAAAPGVASPSRCLARRCASAAAAAAAAASFCCVAAAISASIAAAAAASLRRFSSRDEWDS